MFHIIIVMLIIFFLEAQEFLYIFAINSMKVLVKVSEVYTEINTIHSLCCDNEVSV